MDMFSSYGQVKNLEAKIKILIFLWFKPDCFALNFGLLCQRSKCAESPVYSRISYFGHACPKLYFVLISRLTGKYATQDFQNFSSLLVRGSNAYFWSNLESGSKVFFSMFSCYIGIVLHETAWWHSYNIEHFYITRFLKSRQSGRKIMVLHCSRNTNIYIRCQTNLYLPSLEIVCLQC